MTRKDYIRLAEDLRITLVGMRSEEADGFFAAVECIIDALKRDNARFDTEKFYAAVRGES